MFVHKSVLFYVLPVTVTTGMIKCSDKKFSKNELTASEEGFHGKLVQLNSNNHITENAIDSGCFFLKIKSYNS